LWSTEEGDATFLDLERCSIGLLEWDLVSTAVRYSTFGTMSAADYRDLAQAYGHDVMGSPSFETLRTSASFGLPATPLSVRVRTRSSARRLLYESRPCAGREGRGRGWIGSLSNNLARS
jgi:hypothetical protein